VNTPRSDEDRLKLMKLMVFLLQRKVCVEIGINAAHLSSYCCQANFWNTVVVKHLGDVTRLQALVNKKRIVITKEVVHEILQLNDAEGVICLPNEEIFAGLARMGYEKPSTKLTFYKAFFLTQWKFFIHTILHSLSAKRASWNEFSSAMASVVICLSSGQRVGKGFSGVETPLFESMLVVKDIAEEVEAQVQAQGDDVQEPAAEEVGPEVVPPTPTPPLPPSPIIPSSPLHQPPCPPQPQDAKVPSLLFQRVLDTCSALTHRVEGLEHDKAAQQLEIVKLKARVKKMEKINKVKSSKLRRLKKVLSMQEDDTEVQEAVEIVTIAKLMTEVVTAAATQVVAASTPIPAAKPKILTITAAPAVSTRRRKGVIIRDPKEELSSDTPAKTPKVKDKGKGILIEAPKPMKKKDQIEMDAEYARKLQEEINKEHEETYKNIDWNAALDHVQSKEPWYIKRYHGMKKKPQTESEACKNMILYLKNTEGYKMDFFKGMKKLHEQAKEDEDLKKQLEVVDDEDDDVFIEATPIGRKVPVVDYEIVMINNKPRYKIIKADGTHQLYISFIILLKNFNREDLEDLWRIVKARFSTSKPTNFSDDYLLSTLKTMFEKTDRQDAIWRNKHSVYGQELVKSWKLLTSYGVHIISLTTTTFIMLVEKRYPPSMFTLEQLVNVVRLKVEEKSKMSLELLRFTRQQLQEYQQG
nr:hypothetical protein [Tanacetum cinerariifolium]